MAGVLFVRLHSGFYRVANVVVEVVMDSSTADALTSIAGAVIAWLGQWAKNMIWRKK